MSYKDRADVVYATESARKKATQTGREKNQNPQQENPPQGDVPAEGGSDEKTW